MSPQSKNIYWVQLNSDSGNYDFHWKQKSTESAATINEGIEHIVKIDANKAVDDVINVVIFNAGQTYPIIHRVISIEETPNGKVYQTKGDNNQVQLYFERDVSENVVIGKALFRIPKLGWLKLAFVELIKAFR